MREKSSDRPPRGALMWPSSEVPAPNGMIGTRWVRATRTTSLTSSWVSTQMTASGGWLGIQVMVLACWRRIASPVCSRSPKRWRSTAMAVATPSALGLVAASVAVFIPHPSLGMSFNPMPKMLTPGPSSAPGACWRTMFTQSCCDVKVTYLAAQHRNIDLPVQRDDHARLEAAHPEYGPCLPMSCASAPKRLAASNENVPNCLTRAEAAETASNVRALATGAALATAIDNSPAVLVSIYDYAHRYRDKGRRTA